MSMIRFDRLMLCCIVFSVVLSGVLFFFCFMRLGNCVIEMVCGSRLLIVVIDVNSDSIFVNDVLYIVLVIGSVISVILLDRKLVNLNCSFFMLSCVVNLLCFGVLIVMNIVMVMLISVSVRYSDVE